jgi:hypothetical protein
MLTFFSTKNDYVFEVNKHPVALGSYEPEGFVLCYQDDYKTYTNAMQAFCFLRSIYEQ